jgi:hypothetical protein
LRKGSQIVSKKKQHSKKCRGYVFAEVKPNCLKKETTPQKM